MNVPGKTVPRNYNPEEVESIFEQLRVGDQIQLPEYLYQLEETNVFLGDDSPDEIFLNFSEPDAPTVKFIQHVRSNTASIHLNEDDQFKGVVRNIEPL